MHWSTSSKSKRLQESFQRVEEFLDRSRKLQFWSVTMAFRILVAFLVLSVTLENSGLCKAQGFECIFYYCPPGKGEVGNFYYGHYISSEAVSTRWNIMTLFQLFQWQLMRFFREKKCINDCFGGWEKITVFVTLCLRSNICTIWQVDANYQLFP